MNFSSDKLLETKRFVLYEWFRQLHKLNHTELTAYVAFYNKLQKCRLLEKKTKLAKCDQE